MRKASTYRGARRNRADLSRRFRDKWNAWEVANAKADLGHRRVMAHNAVKAVSIAMAAAGVLASPVLATHAFLNFYRAQPKRTRVVDRIVRGLAKSLPTQRAA